MLRSVAGIFSGGSKYLVVKELGLKDHINNGFWDRSLEIIRYLDPLGFVEKELNS